MTTLKTNFKLSKTAHNLLPSKNPAKAPVSAATASSPKLNLHRNLGIALLTMGAVVAPHSTALAATLTWNGGGGTPSDGAATWDSSTSNWWNGAGTTWSAGSDAWFGVGTGSTTSYIVNVGFAPSVGNITFANQAYTLTGGTLSLLTSGTSTITVSASAATISSVLVGTTGLIKSGTGTLILGTSNTYTGATTINAGAVRVTGITNTLGNGTGGAVTLNGGALEFNSASGLTPAWPMTIGASGGTLRNLAAGNITLGSNTLFGSGTLTLTFAGATASRFRDGGTGTQNNFSGKWVIDSNNTNLGNTFYDTSSMAAWGVGSNADDFVTLKNGGKILDRGYDLTKGITIGSGGGNIAAAGGVVFTISGKISGAAGNDLTLDTGNAITLSNTANAWQGNLILVNSGTLKMGASGVLPAAAGNVSFTSTGIVDMNGFNETVGGITTAQTGAVIDNKANSTNSILDVGGNNQSTTFAGVLRNSGTGSTLALTKSGIGSLTLSNSNNYSGATTISAGTLQFAKAVSLYSGTTGSWTAANIKVASAGTLALNVGAATNEFTTGNVTTLLTNLGGANGTGTTGFAAGSAIGFDTTNASGGTFTVADNLADSTGSGGGAVGLTKLGTNNLVLTGSNTYSGPTTVSGGFLIGQNGTTGSPGATNVLNAFGTSVIALGNGTFVQLKANGSGNNQTIAVGNNVTVGGTASIDVNQLTVGTAGNTMAMGTLSIGNGQLNVTGANTYGLSFTTATLSGSATSFNPTTANLTVGAIAQSGVSSLTKTGAGSLTLVGTNSYTGTTTVSAGTLLFAKQGALYSGSTALWTVANLIVSASAAAAFRVGGADEFTSGNLDTLLLLGGASNGFISGATIGIDTTNAGGNFAYASAIANPNGGVNTLNVTKLGAGTLTLTGSNTYTGATTVTSGSLQLGDGTSGHDGSIASASLVNSASLVYNLSGTSTYTGVISGTGTLIKTGAGTLVLGTSNSYTGATTINQGLVQVSNVTNTLGNGTGTVNLNGGGIIISSTSGVTEGWAINVGAAGGSLMAGGAGRPAFTSNKVTGSGTLTLKSVSGGANRFLSAAQPNFGGKWVLDGVQLDYPVDSWGTATGDDVMTMKAGTVLLLGGTLGTTSQGITLASGANAISVSGNASTDSVIASKISGAGSLTTTLFAASGRLYSFTLSNPNNSWTGGLTIGDGASAPAAFKLGADEVIPNGSGFGNVTLNGTWVYLDLNGHSETINGLVSTSTSVKVDNMAAGTASLTVGDGDTTSSFAGSIVNTGGALSLTKIGAGTLTLTGSNSYTGATTLGGGVLSLGGSNALLGAGNIAFTGGYLQFTASNTRDYSGQIKNSTGAIAIDTNSQNVVFASAIDSSNTGGVVRGYYPGTLTLAGSNTYTGDTRLIHGTLALANSYALAGGGNIVFAGNGSVGDGALQFSGSNTVDYSARIKSSTGVINLDTNGQNVTFAGILDSSNSGGLIKTGTGTLTLTASNGYTGATTVNSGALQLGDGTSGHDGSIASASLANSASLVYNLSGTSTYTGVISGTGTLTKTGAGTLVLGTSNTYTGATTINQGTVQVSNVTNTLGNGTGTVNLNGGSILVATTSSLASAWAINVGASGGILLGSGTGGRFAFNDNTLSGTGTLTLKSSNTFSRFYPGTQTGFGGKWVIDGAGGAFVDNSTGNIWGSGTGTDVVTLTNNGAVLMRGGTLGSSTQGFTIGSGGGYFNAAGGTFNTIAAQISSTGTDQATFTMGNGGGITLSNTANSYSGNTYVVASAAGANYLKMGAANVIPSGTGKGNVLLVNGGATAALDLNGFDQSINGLTTANTDSFVDNRAASTTATLTVGNGDATSTFVGSVQNSGSNAVLNLTKIGTGTLTLSGSNTYSGETTVNAGTLQFSNAGAVGSGTIALSATNGSSGSYRSTLNISGTVVGRTLTMDSSINRAVLYSTGATAWNGAIILLGGSNANGAPQIADLSGPLTIAGTISGSNGGLGLTLRGNSANDVLAATVSIGSTPLNRTADAATNIWTITSSGNTWGATAIASGTLRAGAANAFPSTTAVTLSAANSGLDLDGFDVAIGSLAGAGNATLGANSLTTGNANTNTTFSGVLSGAGGKLVKTGTGIFTLTGSNSYTGGTTVNNGTLQLGNSKALGTGGLTVNGGTLDLHGNSVSVPGFSGAGGSITNMASGTSTLTTVASGTSTYAGNIADGAGAVVLTNSGAGTLILSGSLSMRGLNASSGETQLAQSGSIGAISLGAAGKLELTANGVNTAKVLDTSSLSIAAGGTLDLWDNALILRDQTAGGNQGTNLSTVQGLVNTAFDNGAWDKPGITSSSVLADLGAYSVLTVMVYDNTVLGIDSFEGINGLLTDNGGNQVMLKTTYLGDFDGNGIVNSADYGWLDFYYGYGLTVGDLNGDGQVNSADYNGIDYGYGYQAYGVLAGAQAASGASAAPAAAPEAVPEPGSIGLMITGLVGLFGLRRSTRREISREKGGF